MNLKLQLENVLFLDIETIPQYENWDDVSETHQTLFEQKTAYQRKEKKLRKSFMNEQEFGQNSGKSFVFLWVTLPITN